MYVCTYVRTNSESSLGGRLEGQHRGRKVFALGRFLEGRGILAPHKALTHQSVLKKLSADLVRHHVLPLEGAPLVHRLDISLTKYIYMCIFFACTYVTYMCEINLCTSSSTRLLHLGHDI